MSNEFKPTYPPLITIFGSCRQDSIYELFPVTSIKNNLTYPHYTREIIQAIEYCKESNNDFNELVYFRTSLLKNKLIKKNFSIEFNNTDIFIVEIASRISYKYKNKYIHHEAYDNPVFKAKLTEDVEIHDLTDEEIEEDIIKIRDLTYPKKLIIVTHIATNRYGKRYDLVSLIKNIANKLDVTVIDPYEIIKDYPKEIVFEKNDSERHYTTEGHKIIKAEYKKVIEVELKKNKKKLVQVYSNNQEKINEHSYHGFGDFLMGVISVNQFAKKLNLQPRVSFNNHQINDFFYNKEFISTIDCIKTRYIFDSPELIDFIDGGNVFTNKKPKNINSDDKDFLISNCLQPRIGFQKYINKTLVNLNLSNDFGIVHVRGPDEDQINSDFIKKINRIISKHCLQNKKYLLLSNSEKILSEINRNNLLKTGLERCHLGLSNNEPSGLRDTLIEFIIMSMSSEIIQCSIYPWGSNFSNIVSEVYNIPIKKFNIPL